MKNVVALVILLSLSGCASSKLSHEPGGPYYFKSGVTYKGYRPTGEITKAEADSLADKGNAYYMAHFGPEGNPAKILKVYRGQTNLYWQAGSDVPEP